MSRAGVHVGLLLLGMSSLGGIGGCKPKTGTAASQAASAYSGAAGGSLVFEPVSAHVDSGDTADTADTGAQDTSGTDTGADTDRDIRQLTIEIGETAWTLTLLSGPTELPWSTTDGLLVNDSRLLPATVKDGSTGDGVEVTDFGERSVWYGMFPDVGTTEVSAGSLAGEWAFARDVGPIVAHYADEDWELVYYQ